MGVSPNIYKLKATLCGLLCLRKVCPGILVWNGMQFPLGTRLGKFIPFLGLIMGRSFRLRSLHSTENPGGLFFGYPGFWVVDMFDWLLVGLAAFDQHDEGYHYERCSRCCCGGD